MQTAKAINTFFSFFIEIAMLLALSIAGYHLGNAKWRLGLSIALPLLVIVIWALWAAPKSSGRLKRPWLTLLKLFLYAATIVLLFCTGYVLAAFIFGACSFINEGLAVWFERIPLELS